MPPSTPLYLQLLAGKIDHFLIGTHSKSNIGSLYAFETDHFFKLMSIIHLIFFLKTYGEYSCVLVKILSTIKLRDLEHPLVT